MFVVAAHFVIGPNKLSQEEGIQPSIPNIWVNSLSVIKKEISIGVLSMEWRRHGWERKLVIIQECCHNWFSHVGEDVVSNEVNRVFNDYDSEFDDLIHDDAYKLVVVVEIGVSEVDFGTEDDWLEVTHVGASEDAVDVEIEVFEFKGYFAGFWEYPGIYLLISFDIPFFESWEVDLHHWLSHGVDEV